MTAPTPRAPRREIAESRERILQTAERFFAENGIDASLHTLADEAGVGVATLFRRFAGRDELVRALYDRAVARVDDAAARVSSTQPPGWDRLHAKTLAAVEIIFAMPILPAIMRRMAEIDPDYRPGDRWIAPLLEDVRVAQEQGTLRPDANGFDLAMIPLAAGAIAHFPEPTRGVLGARLVSTMFEGLRAPTATPYAETAPITVEQYHRGAHGLGD